MAYFSNGTECSNYQSAYCGKCWHQKPNDGGCAVWFAHMLHNCNDEDSILHILIPRNSIKNELCKMFVPKEIERRTR